MAKYHTTSGKLADPAFRAERARKAAQASHNTDAHIRALVNAAPPLTAEQRAQLTALLHAPAGSDAGAA